jgi:predicted GNAT family acetyltransferase
MSNPITVTDNPAEGRYEAIVDGYLAHADYIRQGTTITFTHTEVAPELEGRGVGGALARFALEDARAQGLAVIPLCPFIASYIRRHPEYSALVPEREQHRIQTGHH